MINKVLLKVLYKEYESARAIFENEIDNFVYKPIKVTNRGLLFLFTCQNSYKHLEKLCLKIGEDGLSDDLVERYMLQSVELLNPWSVIPFGMTKMLLDLASDCLFNGFFFFNKYWDFLSKSSIESDPLEFIQARLFKVSDDSDEFCYTIQQIICEEDEYYVTIDHIKESFGDSIKIERVQNFTLNLITKSIEYFYIHSQPDLEYCTKLILIPFENEKEKEIAFENASKLCQVQELKDYGQFLLEAARYEIKECKGLLSSDIADSLKTLGSLMESNCIVVCRGTASSDPHILPVLNPEYVLKA